MIKKLLIISSIGLLLTAPLANSATIKLFYYENGQRGWKGGHKTVEACEKAAKSNGLAPDQYYCSRKQSYKIERKLGWRK